MEDGGYRVEVRVGEWGRKDRCIHPMRCVGQIQGDWANRERDCSQRRREQDHQIVDAPTRELRGKVD